MQKQRRSTVLRSLVLVFALMCLLLPPVSHAEAPQQNPPPPDPNKSQAVDASQSPQAYSEIIGSPLRIRVYSDGSLAVYRYGVQQFYNGNASGFYLWSGGRAWGPSVPANEYPPSNYDQISLSGLYGNGTSTAPWTIFATVQVSLTGLQIQQTVSYVNGDNYIYFAWTVRNLGGDTQTYTFFHAGDLYLAGDDYGTGYYNPITGAIGGRNASLTQYELLIPVTPPSAYQEAGYKTIWRAISSYSTPGTGFNNTTVSNYIDNGAGLQWGNRVIRPGATDSIRDYLSFADIPVIPQAVADPYASIVTVDPATVFADGESASVVTVTLLDSLSRPVPGKNVQVLTDRAEDQVTQPGGLSDNEGKVSAAVRSTKPGQARITVRDITDGVTLAARPAITFAEIPRGPLADAIRNLVGDSQAQIRDAKSEATTVAKDGDFFRQKLTSDAAEEAIKLAIDSWELASTLAGVDWKVAGKALSSLATTGGKAAVNASWRGYVEDQTTRYFVKRLYDAGQQGALSQAMADSMFKSGAWFMFKNGVKEGLIDWGAESLGAGTAHIMTGTSDPFGLENRWFSGLADDFSKELNGPRDEALMALPYLNLSVAQVETYRQDLYLRNQANAVRENRLHQMMQPLHDAHSDRVASDENWARQWLPFGLKYGTVILATVFWDGAGYYVANLATEGVSFLYNRWESVKKISEDGRLMNQGWTFLNGVGPYTLLQINQNSTNGLLMIESKTASAQPQVALGAPAHYSVGECRDMFGLKFVEEASYTDVSVTNSSSESLEVEGSALYQHKPSWFAAATSQYAEGSPVTVPPHQTGTVRTWYRNGSNGGSPVEPSLVVMDFLGATSTGTYWIGSRQPTYRDPQRIDSYGRLNPCVFNAPEAVAAGVPQNSPAPTVPFPITEDAMQLPRTDLVGVAIFVENPLTTSLNAEVTGPIPAGWQVVDADGGTLRSGAVVWSVALGPGAVQTYRITLRPPAGVAQVALSGVSLKLTNPDSGQTAGFAARDQAPITLAIVDATAAMPAATVAGQEAAVRVTLHNASTTGATSGTLHVVLEDANGTDYDRADYGFTLAASGSQVAALSLTAPYPAGLYQVVGTVKLGTRTLPAFSQPIYSLSTSSTPLSSGWNLVSAPLDPEPASTDNAFESIRATTNVVLAFERSGLAWYPDTPTFNTLKTIDATHGYWVRSSGSATLRQNGLPVPASTPISLEPGWNLVGYLPTSPLPVATALASIQGKYDVVLGFDGGALSYYPGQPAYSNLQTLRPGRGYWIKTNQPAVLIYPASATTQAADTPPEGAPPSTTTAAAPQAPAGVVPTNQWMNVISAASTYNGRPLPVGALVTAVGDDGRKLGEVRAFAPGSFGVLSVYGDDPYSTELDGARPGERIRLMINGQAATTANAAAVTWTANGDLLTVDLTATGPEMDGHYIYLPSAAR